VIIPERSLVVSARVAAKIERALTDAEDRAHRNGTRLDAEVAETLAELHDLANWWRASVASAEPGPPAETPPPSATMTTSQAADRMHVSPSRIRQLLRAGALAGERVDGHWHVDPAALEGDRP
jgi:hypothetical protein